MKKILTLCIVHQNDPAYSGESKVLLGMKKRGFGMGKWNGFGGKVNKDESIEDAAKRELFEEAGITAMDLQKLGILDFSWKDREDIIQVSIFKSKFFTGTPKESEEMKPQWFGVKEIPFDSMWSSDIHWFKLLLEDKKFSGKFIFDENNNVLEYELL